MRSCCRRMPIVRGLQVVGSTFPRKGLPVYGDASQHSKLVGVFCRDAEEAAAGAGTEFLVLRNVLENGELVALCDSVPVPVFARGIGLEQAWALGASGCNEIGCSGFNPDWTEQ